MARSVVGTTVCELLIQLNAPLCCHGCTAVPDCTVLCQGGPSPHLPASNTTGDQRVGPTEELGGGGAFESQQHFQRVRPDLGTRASKRGHCTPCATPRAAAHHAHVQQKELIKGDCNTLEQILKVPIKILLHKMFITFVLMKVHNFRLS